MQMRQRDAAALDAKYTKELADAKAEMMLCVMDVATSSSVVYQSSLSSVREATTASGVDNAASPDWQTPGWTGIISPQRGWSTMQKQLEGT